MTRSLSLTARQALFAQQTGECFVLLLTISHDDIDPPIRVCSDAASVVSNGQTYLAFPFDISLPDETDETLSSVRLRIDNVDRQIVEAVRSITSAADVTLQIVMASSPDTVEAGPFNFTLRSVEYDALVVEGDLQFEDLLNEGFPAGSFTPDKFGALF